MRLAPDELKAFLTRWPDDPKHSQEITAGVRGALIGHLNDVCGTNEKRRQFIRWIFGVDSSADLWPAYWYQIRLWLDPKPTVSDGQGGTLWAIRAECYDDARAVLRLQAEAEYAAKIAGGQLPLLPGL